MTRRDTPAEPSFLAELNEEQRAAVLCTEGPVLILAGAGTGKTRVIACRVAALLRGAPSLTPQNVLALTFSRKAAEEMRERVETLVGTHPDEMPFYTFHGFCHRFLQEFALELGLPARFRLLDPAEAWVFFRKILPELKLKCYANLSDPAAPLEGFIRFIGRAKDEMVSPEEVAAHARKLEDRQEREQLLEVARAYEIYRRKMRAAGNMDFGDLIVETIRALRERPKLLERARARYRAILVDEFQDTNVAQIELLRLLAGSTGNLCVVGDDDQAIYRFRGASFASFLLMKEAFPSVKVIRLTRNYRSTPTILGAAGRLIRHNEPDRYDPEKRLWTENADGPAVELLDCRDEEHEAQAVARRLRELYDARPENDRRWDPMAVLYRAHAHREPVIEALRGAGIPFSVRGGSSLFDQPAVKDLQAFLQALWNPADAVSFFRLISHPVWGVPVEELIALSRLAREREVPILRLLETEAAVLPEAVKSAVSRLRSELETLRRGALRSGAEELVQQVIERSFLRVLFRLPAGPGESAPVALAQILRLARRYAQNDPEARDLGSFLGYLDSMSRVAANDFQNEEEPDREDGVRLMTVHQAKGLEFDWVILLEMVQGRFPARGRSEAIPFPVELMKESLPQGDYHLQEERRLCYVACTRAKKGLILASQDQTRRRPSIFLQELEGREAGGGLVRRPMPVPAGISSEPVEPEWPGGMNASSLAEERQLLELLERVRAIDPADESSFTRSLREIQAIVARARSSRSAGARAPKRVTLAPGQKFSFSQMETFRYCPLKYLYAYVYRIPTRATPQMLFGIDLHDCLEGFYAQVMEGQVLPLEELLSRFRRLHAPARYGEPQQDEEYRKLGERILTDYYRKHEGAFKPPVFVEKPFSLQMGEVLLQGVVDRADPLEGGGVEIVDYKSGKSKEKATAEEQLQLRLYALAAKEVFHLEPRRISFYYLRDNSVLSFEPAPEVLEQTKERVLELIGRIRSSDFSPDPSKVKCQWCDYRRLCPASMA